MGGVLIPPSDPELFLHDLLDRVAWGTGEVPDIDEVCFETLRDKRRRKRPVVGEVFRALLVPSQSEIALVAGPQSGVWGLGLDQGAIWLAVEPVKAGAEPKLLLPPLAVADDLWRNGYVVPAEHDVAYTSYVNELLADTAFYFLNDPPSTYLGEKLPAEVERSFRSPSDFLFARGFAQVLAAEQTIRMS